VLFDKGIGRKRDVGGVVLASGLFLFGFGKGLLIFFEVLRGRPGRDLNDGHVSTPSPGFLRLDRLFSS